VEHVTGLPRSSIYEQMAENTFPKPVPLGGRAVGWLEAEIIDWTKKRIAERDKCLAPKRRDRREALDCTPEASPSASRPDRPSIRNRERGSPMKNRKREICTSGR
jgi:prophage regulatory protein